MNTQEVKVDRQTNTAIIDGSHCQLMPWGIRWQWINTETRKVHTPSLPVSIIWIDLDGDDE